MTDDIRIGSLLRTIDSPADLRKLPLEELPTVCREVREEIIDVLSTNPGHLASSLGAVELAVALHYTMDTPNDRVVWDVGHQAYAHKILTGRRDAFVDNRKLGGLKPFLSPEESEYDACVSGHASNAISIGLGMDVAARLRGESRRVVSVIGDGAMSGGLAFEGLNNAAALPNNMLIILNDNNMSIAHSVGGMKQYLMSLHTSNTYNNLRFRVARVFSSLGLLTSKRKRRIIQFNNYLKSIIFNHRNVFEGFDIRYFGPIDGNDVTLLVRTLNEIKDMEGPKILHISTVKGKGMRAAEENPMEYHAPGYYDSLTGKRKKSDDSHMPPKYQKVFGETLLELAEKNPRIVGVTPAMSTGCSMDIMMNVMPERTFDVGIAEGHAVTFSAGMAAREGLLPFCNIYSSFAQRAYDNVIHDVAISNLPVVICLDRAGLVGEDGPTHHGAFDIPMLRTVPNVTLASPMDEHELRHLMYTAQLDGKGTFVIRYPRGRGENPDWRCPMHEVEVGTGRKLKDGDALAVLTLGPIGNVAARAIAQVEQATGKTVAHYDMRFVKPLDTALLDEIGKKFNRILTVEDGALQGGFGAAVMEYLSDQHYALTLDRAGLPDAFVEHGPVGALYKKIGIDEQGLAARMTALLNCATDE